MKIELLLSSLITCWVFVGFGQTPREVKLKKTYSEMDYAPQIEGYFDGVIPVDLICSAKGLTTKKGIKILTFDIFYCNSSKNGVHVIGNTIPDMICVELQTNCLHQDVHFNNIKAIDSDGSIKNLTPFLLRPVLKNNE